MALLPYIQALRRCALADPNPAEQEASAADQIIADLGFDLDKPAAI